MKFKFKICILAALLLIIYTSGVLAFDNNNNSIKLTDKENNWLNENKDRLFVLGTDPYAGIEYFKADDEEKGYLIPLIKTIEDDLGIKIKLEASKSW